jgi:hypothetical protein
MPENVVSIFMLPFIACICGIGPLIFAGLLFYNARRGGRLMNNIKSAKNPPISAIQPDTGLVRVNGVISYIANPLFPQDPHPQTMLRLRIEAWKESASDDHMEWAPTADKIKTVPFRLSDGHDSIWVFPDRFEKQLMGPGVIPTPAQVEDAVLILQIPPGAMAERKLRYRLWELRQGQQVTVVGKAQQINGQMVIAKTKDQPLIISPGEISIAAGETKRQTTTSWILTLVLGIPGLIILCGSIIGFGAALLKMVAAIPK